MYQAVQLHAGWELWITISVSPVGRAGVMKRPRRGVRNTLNTGSHGIQILRTGTISDLVTNAIMGTGHRANSVLYESLASDTVKSVYKKGIPSRKR